MHETSDQLVLGKCPDQRRGSLAKTAEKVAKISSRTFLSKTTTPFEKLEEVW
jgi:hypothetical protein